VGGEGGILAVPALSGSDVEDADGDAAVGLESLEEGEGPGGLVDDAGAAWWWDVVSGSASAPCEMQPLYDLLHLLAASPGD
jgi:hypothetical protein